MPLPAEGTPLITGDIASAEWLAAMGRVEGYAPQVQGCAGSSEGKTEVPDDVLLGGECVEEPEGGCADEGDDVATEVGTEAEADVPSEEDASSPTVEQGNSPPFIETNLTERHFLTCSRALA